MTDKPLRWIHGEVKTPPMSLEARRKIGFLLRELQEGMNLSMPHSRPMPTIGPRCHELRVSDQGKTWRLIHRIDADAVLILEVFEKKTSKTPQQVIDVCRQRLKRFEEAVP